MLSLAVYLGLVQASRFYSENICASLFAIAAFADGLFSGRFFFRNVIHAFFVGAVAWVIFKLLRRTDSVVAWLAIAAGGAIVLTFV